MAYRTSSTLLALLFVFNILLAMPGQAFAGRQLPNSKAVDKKEPDWFIGSDGTLLIPGVGRVTLPPIFESPPYEPYPGGSRETGSDGGYIPGGDYTAVPEPEPEPGIEAPNPGHAGGSPH